MKKNYFNGFATEAEYERVSNIIFNKINKMFSTARVGTESKGKTIEVMVTTVKTDYDYIFYLDKTGVFFVRTEGSDAIDNIGCKIMIALNDCSKDIFNI